MRKDFNRAAVEASALLLGKIDKYAKKTNRMRYVYVYSTYFKVCEKKGREKQTKAIRYPEEKQIEAL